MKQSLNVLISCLTFRSTIMLFLCHAMLTLILQINRYRHAVWQIARVRKQNKPPKIFSRLFILSFFYVLCPCWIPDCFISSGLKTNVWEGWTPQHVIRGWKQILTAFTSQIGWEPQGQVNHQTSKRMCNSLQQNHLIMSNLDNMSPTF